MIYIVFNKKIVIKIDQENHILVHYTHYKRITFIVFYCTTHSYITDLTIYVDDYAFYTYILYYTYVYYPRYIHKN